MAAPRESEPGQAGGGAGQDPEVGKGPAALVPTSVNTLSTRPHFFDDSSAKWTSWGLGNRFCSPSRSKAYSRKCDYRREG